MHCMLNLAFNYESARIGKSQLIHADCFEWLGRVAENTFHAIVTDPPYGVKEYDFDQLEKRANGNGGRVAGAEVLRSPGVPNRGFGVPQPRPPGAPPKTGKPRRARAKGR